MCVFNSKNTRVFRCCSFTVLFAPRRSLYPDPPYAWCVLFSPSPNETGAVSWQGSGRFPLPGREAPTQPLVCFSDSALWSLAFSQLCTVDVRACWRPESEFRRKRCLSGRRKWSQTNKLLPGSLVGPLCPVSHHSNNWFFCPLLLSTGHNNARSRWEKWPQEGEGGGLCTDRESVGELRGLLHRHGLN